MELAKLAEMVYNHTMEWGKKNGFKEIEPLTEKQKKWKLFFQDHSSYDPTFHMALVEELTGEDLSFMKLGDTSKNVVFTFGIVVVPKANYNSHSYELGKPILCREAPPAYFMDRNGSIGNHMDKTHASISLPTLEQVTELLTGIKKKNKSFYMKLVDFMEKKYEETLRVPSLPATSA